MKYDYVFWDWNGTLFDDAVSSWHAVNDMLSARKLPLITFDEYREYVDVPIIRFYEKVMDVSKESMEDLSVEFHSLCSKHFSGSPLSDGAEALLKLFKDNGVKQYIFSSSRIDAIIPKLTHFGIDKYFDSVLGADDCYAGSKIERTENFIKNNCISPNRVVFIGDMVHDSEVATIIGSDCILVSSGHQSEEKLIRTGREVVPTLSALLNKFTHEGLL